MSKLLSIIAVSATLAASAGAEAAIFTPDFSDYSFPGTQFTVDAAANTFYSFNYGINISNAYLYKDDRDTFDGLGIANGTVAEIGTIQSGRIDFIDTTDFVNIDYLAIYSTIYNAYSSTNVLLSSISRTGTGSLTLNGGTDDIAYLTFTTTGGYGTVSGLSYNYDGTTGGGNTDLHSVSEPETFAMMLARVC